MEGVVGGNPEIHPEKIRVSHFKWVWAGNISGPSTPQAMTRTTIPTQQPGKTLPAYLNGNGSTTSTPNRKTGRAATRKKRHSRDRKEIEAHYFDDAFFALDHRADNSEEFIHPLPHPDFGEDSAYETPETAWSVHYSPRKKDSLDAYLSSLEKYQPLSKAEEQEAAKAHLDARIRLINHLGRSRAAVEQILEMCAANANPDTAKQIALCRDAVKAALDKTPQKAGSMPPLPSSFQSGDFSQPCGDLNRCLNNLRIRSVVLISAVKSLSSPRQSQLDLACGTPVVPSGESNRAEQETGSPAVTEPRSCMSAEELSQFANTARELEGKWISARNKLVEPNLRFVVHQVKNLVCPGMPLADLIAEGNQALIEAADSFDPSKNIKFCSYAGTFLQRQVTRAVDDKARLIRMPVHACAATRKIYAVNRRLAQELPLNPTDFDIAAETGFTVEKVRELSKAAMPPRSIHEKTLAEGEQTVEDLIPDPQDWETRVYGPDGVTAETLRIMLNPLMPLLSECQRLVIASLHGFNGAAILTEEEAASALKMTINQVRAHHAGALAVIENHFRSRTVAAA
jgi:RNA polymerase sigma factor (sigma-70 family)